MEQESNNLWYCTPCQSMLCIISTTVEMATGIYYYGTLYARLPGKPSIEFTQKKFFFAHCVCPDVCLDPDTNDNLKIKRRRKFVLVLKCLYFKC